MADKPVQGAAGFRLHELGQGLEVGQEPVQVAGKALSISIRNNAPQLRTSDFK